MQNREKSQKSILQKNHFYGKPHETYVCMLLPYFMVIHREK